MTNPSLSGRGKSLKTSSPKRSRNADSAESICSMRREAQGRLKVGQPIAIIDIGSNSVRLVVYEGLARVADADLQREGAVRARPPRRDDRTPRRGGGREGALRALARFRVLCQTMDVARRLRARHRGRARRAERRGFLDAASRRCGRAIELLSGARGGAALRARRRLGLPRAGRRRRRPGRRQPRAGRRATATRSGEGVTLPLGGLALQDLSGGSLEEGAEDRPRGARTGARAARAPARAHLLRRRRHVARARAAAQAATRLSAARDARLPIDPADGLDFLKLVEQVGQRRR